MFDDPYTLADYFEDAHLPESSIAEWQSKVTLNPVRIPAKHQVDDLNHLARHIRCKLLNETGVGKTLPLQAYGLWLCGQGNKVIYLMPPVLIEQFLLSFAFTYQGYAQYVSSVNFNMEKSVRLGYLDRLKSGEQVVPDILVMSYVMFSKHHKELKELGYSCVIVDEATVAKTPSSQIHKNIKIFAGACNDQSNGVVLVTGTPIDTNIEDAYGLIAITNPNRYGSFRAFTKAHCITTTMSVRFERPDGSVTFKDVDRIVGYKNLDYLNASLYADGRRVLKKDVSDLPPKLITEIPIALSKPHLALYKRLVDERLAELGDKVIDLTTSSALYQAMQQTIMNPFEYTDERFDNHALQAIDTLLESLQGHKVLIYCWYTKTIKQLLVRYAEHNPAVLFGETHGSKEVQRMKFISDPTCRMMLANPRSGGVGVDQLQTVCSHVICAEIFPLPGLFQQAIDRLHRNGQTETVNVYLLVAMKTIAVKLRNDLIRKDGNQESVVRDKRTVLLDLMGSEGLKGVI